MEDAKGQIWAGTYNGGLNCIDLETGDCQVYTINNGLLDNSVSGILQDSLGNIWSATGKGLSCFNNETKTFQNFTKEDGLPSNTIKGRCFCKHNNHVFIAGTNNGIFYFDPIKLIQNRFRQRTVSITNFEVVDSPKDFKYFVNNQEKVELSAQVMIQFHHAGHWQFASAIFPVFSNVQSGLQNRA